MLVCLPSLAAAASVAEAPKLNADDSWTMHTTVDNRQTGWSDKHYEIKVARVTSSHIFQETKQVGSSQAPVEMILGPDWSRARNVNGTETTVNRPLTFPLSMGKSWSIDFTEQNPNKNEKSVRWQNNYKITDYGTVETPAGKFEAFKIEVEGNWTSVREPQQSVTQGVQVAGGNTTMVTQSNKTGQQTITGNIYREYWYSPEVKHIIKSVEESFSSDGTRFEKTTEELETYTLTH